MLAISLSKSIGSIRANQSLHRLLPALQTRNVVLVPSTTYKKRQNETHHEKNVRLQRHISPHLSIYKFQLTSVLSITHRFTGIILTGYAAALASFSLPNLPYTIENVLDVIRDAHLSPTTALAIKAVVALPLAYHICNGIRHMTWDTGRALTIKGVYTTGYVMLAGTIATSLLLANL